MTRKKVQLAWIINDSARRTSLKKRRLGLLKKVSELTTLCDVEACIIIYSPGENEPMVWPNQTDQVQRVIGEFHEVPQMEREKKMVNQETYLLDMAAKTQEQLRKFQRANKEVGTNYVMHQIFDQGKALHELSIAELDGITWLMEEKMKEIQKRFEIFQQFPSQPAADAGAGVGADPLGDVPLLPQGPAGDIIGDASIAGLGRGGGTFSDALLREQWLNYYMQMNNNN